MAGPLLIGGALSLLGFGLGRTSSGGGALVSDVGTSKSTRVNINKKDIQYSPQDSRQWTFSPQTDMTYIINSPEASVSKKQTQETSPSLSPISTPQIISPITVPTAMGQNPSTGGASEGNGFNDLMFYGLLAGAGYLIYKAVK